MEGSHGRGGFAGTIGPAVVLPGFSVIAGPLFGKLGLGPVHGCFAPGLLVGPSVPGIFTEPLRI